MLNLHTSGVLGSAAVLESLQKDPSPPPPTPGLALTESSWTSLTFPLSHLVSWMDQEGTLDNYLVPGEEGYNARVIIDLRDISFKNLEPGVDDADFDQMLS